MESLERKIQVLPPQVSERIAAGEVIEKPSSVVKELIENSLDAGASEIHVQLKDGGKSLIEVIDNGSGMGPEDLELSIQRHATSKLNSLDDLEKISSLGFRGEALASIAAVSELRIISKMLHSPSAYELQAGEMWELIEASTMAQAKTKAKKIPFGHFIDSSHGTLIQARSLFSQIPVRLKFLKSQMTEVTQVKEWMERLAIAHPQVGFQLMSNERILMNLRPQSISERIKILLADGENFPLLSISNQDEGWNTQKTDLGLNIQIYWLQGLSSHSSKKIVQIVNQRALKDRILQQALLSSFKQSLLPGQFPVLVLKIDINPAALDINVHPTKSEIRFLNQQKIYQTIESLVQKLIQKKGSPAYVATFQVGPQNNSQMDPQYPVQSFNPKENLGMNLWKASEEKKEESFNPILGAQFIGVLFQTYFLYEKERQLLLIDQHAAHERIRYEILKKQFLKASSSQSSSQVLLIPETISFSKENRPLLEERLHWLSRLGFEAEFFADNVLLFRAIPLVWGMQQLKQRLMNLIDRLLSMNEGISENQAQDKNILYDEIIFEKIASEACHSAIRARDSLDLSEVHSVVKELFQTEHPWNCPHGRPTLVQIPEGKLEEWFQRKI